MEIGDIEYNYRQPINFVIGFAGSGKSTELAKRWRPNWLVLTPTHKAKGVLEAKGINNVYTIHSVLKLVPTLNENMRRGQKMQRLSRIGETDLSSITHIAIDEFSMINTYIMDMLLNALPADANVTIFGDPYQLPPVDGDPVDPEWYTDKITELTVQYRAEAPDVVETFMRFMNYIKGTGEMDLRVNLPHGTIKGFNPATDRALAYTNQRVLELNDAIAKELKLPKEISIGEEISINGVIGKLVDTPVDIEYEPLHIYPKCLSKGKLMTERKLEDAIEKVEDDMAKFGTDINQWEVAYIEIDDTIYSFSLDLDHYANSKIRKGLVEEAQFSLIEEYDLAKDIDLKDWCRNNKNSHTVRRGKAWSNFLLHQGLIWDMRRPFASTVHKAQGQEFDTVYIAQDDMKKAIRNGYYEQYARLMYVALSRAIKKVVIV